MIKKIKENTYVKLIRDLLQNPRTRAAMILVLWMIFFLFVFSIFNVGENHSNTVVHSVMDQFKESKNYEYQITFFINQEIIEGNGIRKENREMFSLADDTYYLEENHLYRFQNDWKVPCENSILLNFDILKLRPDFITNVLSYGNLEYTTKYESGIEKRGYAISTAKFVELYQGTEITDESIVQIEVIEQENQVVEVELNLKNFQKYSGQMIDTYKIQIRYTNIGMVSDLDFE